MRLAVLLTIFYLSFWVATILQRTAIFSQLPPNELGDFLAGITGPLAFFWLVFGYHQQGKALKIQSEELGAAVEQYREQAQNTGALVAHEARQARIDLYRAIAESRRHLQRCRNEIGDVEKFKATGLADFQSALQAIERIAGSIALRQSAEKAEERSLWHRLKKIKKTQGALDEFEMRATSKDTEEVEDTILISIKNSALALALETDIQNFLKKKSQNISSKSEAVNREKEDKGLSEVYINKREAAILRKRRKQ